MQWSGGVSVGLALVAGEAAWADTSEESTGTERFTALVQLVALATLASSLWLMFASRSPAPDGPARLAPFVGSAAALALAIRPARVLVDRRREADVWWAILWRSIASIALIGALVANAPSWGAVAVWPVGIVAGTDVAAFAWRVGIDVDTWAWYRAFLASPLHLGALGASVAAVVSIGGVAGVRVGGVYLLTLNLLAAAACVTAGLVDRVRSHQLASEQRRRERIIADQHRERAHWLHDDVSAKLRIATLRVQNGAISSTDVVALLDDLDHQLRVRQLEEVLASGTASVAEVIQPYVRNAQASGVTVVAVPRFEESSQPVDGSTGRLLARAASIFTSNAIQAGATTLGFELDHGDGWVELRVTDDAGGFDLSTAPAGRALWELARTVGAHALTAQRVGRGTQTSIRIDVKQEGR